MPLIEPSSYAPPLPLRSAHVQTIMPALTRRVEDVAYVRERIETPDEDFLDLDWVRGGARRVAIVSHGLEGSTSRGYMRGMARALHRHGWDVLTWNYRGCSGTPNRRLRSYHSGATDDLHLVVSHALRYSYEKAALVGFSLGGNLTLKYLGERDHPDPRLAAAVVFSVPCDLAAGAAHLDASPGTRLYRHNFLLSLRETARRKKAQFPDALADLDPDAIATLRDFDNRFTAPLHGFLDADDYYARCNCKQFLGRLRLPALLVSAEDDPFLPEACYPIEEARDHPHLFLEIPTYGGHVGFMSFDHDGTYWSERRTVAFLQEIVREN